MKIFFIKMNISFKRFNFWEGNRDRNEGNGECRSDLHRASHNVAPTFRSAYIWYEKKFRHIIWQQNRQYPGCETACPGHDPGINGTKDGIQGESQSGDCSYGEVAATSSSCGGESQSETAPTYNTAFSGGSLLVGNPILCFPAK